MAVTRGTHQAPTTPRRAVVPSDLLPVRLSRVGRRSLRCLAAHGADLHAVARMITDDVDLGGRLVVRAIISSCTENADPRLDDLSAVVVTQWISGAMHGSSGRDVSSPITPLMLDVHRMPDEQRAMLALCKFGGHTYRQAARLLDISPDDGARLLSEALRTLHAA